MHIDCPHCQNPIEIVGEPELEVVCPSCGSSIMLDPGTTRTFLPTNAPRRLGKYELVEQIGVGAFGTVCKARDTELDRIVAITIPRAGNLSSQEDVDRFLREARSAAQLKHPGIVSLYDAVQADGTCYLVSEFVQGATLADRLGAGRLSLCQAAELIADVADALHFAHEHGVVHRDIKPSNIMLRVRSEAIYRRLETTDADESADYEPVLLDCSGSKMEPNTNAGVQGAPAVPRFDLARSALMDVLARLAKSGLRQIVAASLRVLTWDC